MSVDCEAAAQYTDSDFHFSQDCPQYPPNPSATYPLEQNPVQ